MADISIKDSSGNLLSTLDSKDGTTVGDLLDMIGAGVLQKDGVLKANRSYILVPGTYTFGPRQQQQQQQPGIFPLNDVTVSWEARQSTAVPSLPPTDAILKSQVASFPIERAPIHAMSYQTWRNVVPDEILERYFVSVNTGDACVDLAAIISNLIFHPMIIPGTNEDSYHGRIDQCVLGSLDRFCKELTLRRNTSEDSSSTLFKRPDAIACIPGKGCYFRGEEKKIGSNEDPKKELYEKLHEVWPFPGLPYVLGYYSIGTSVTISKVVIDGAVDISAPLDLQNATARLQCWNMMRNIARLLKCMVAIPAPFRIPMDMEDISRGTGRGQDWKRFIRFSGGHVSKECIADTETLVEKQRRVEEVISKFESGFLGVQPIVTHKISSRKRNRDPKLHYVTVFGESIPRVASPRQLKRIVEFLLRTVRDLHDAGITHRDIRLPNVVKSIKDGSFALIDWDDSVAGIENLDNKQVAHLDTTSHAPEMFENGGVHDSSVDLWSIGHLIRLYQEHADANLLGLMERLLKPAEERPSDHQACNTLGI